MNEQRQEEQKTKRRWRRQSNRLLPIWLRLVIVAALIVVSTVIGAMVGYSVLGDGKPLDALKPSTWQHIIDIVEKNTNGH
ncbi:DNA-directed RNA polymerase subunit beta [Anoxybacteroides tepidamans]|uniref:DNA-directed RNA polymerase subunit beta n=1 Tax=Anoxybacteroides tepidamans TaxID=265948 RepID=UPI00047FBF27|nr:DNA-directed RNA polymerase subunit beta [Anoxybacillus tepidamans]